MSYHFWLAVGLFSGIELLIYAGFGADALGWSLLGVFACALSVLLVELFRDSSDPFREKEKHAEHQPFA